MTGVIFQDWLRWFDHLMNGRKVLLLMDNFSAHEAGIEGLEFDDIQLQNTTIVFLPANSTARYQPLDQGIIRTWKAYWRRQWLQYMLYEYDNNRDPIATIDVLKSIRWGLNAWAENVTEATALRKHFQSLELLQLSFLRMQLMTFSKDYSSLRLQRGLMKLWIYRTS